MQCIVASMIIDRHCFGGRTFMCPLTLLFVFGRCFFLGRCLLFGWCLLLLAMAAAMFLLVILLLVVLFVIIFLFVFFGWFCCRFFFLLFFFFVQFQFSLLHSCVILILIFCVREKCMRFCGQCILICAFKPYYFKAEKKH